MMDALTSIPFIDLKDLVDGNLEKRREIAQQFDKALSEIGFVYLINHGVSKEKIKNALDMSKKFFELDLQTKAKYGLNISRLEDDDSKSYCGYTAVNQEQLNKTLAVNEHREHFNFSINTRYQLKTPNPDAPGFNEALIDLTIEFVPLVKNILQLIAESLNLEDKDFFVKNHKSIFEDETIPSFSTLRTLYYPPFTSKHNLNEEDIKSRTGTVRCAEHSDYGIITFLIQEEGDKGLEVKHKNGKWIPAEPIKDAILLNTGDLLQIWSGGHYPATLHRVSVPEDEPKRCVPRQSMAYFIVPDNETQVEPLESRIHSENNSRSISAGDYIKMMINKTYNY